MRFLSASKLATGLSLCAALAAASSAQAGVVTQTIHFDGIAPFGSFTTGTFKLDGWNTAFPIGDIASVQRFYFVFASSDHDYQAHVGPNGGVPSVEIAYLDDANARHAMASVSYYNEASLTVGNENPGYFADLKTLLDDGVLNVSLGGFENHLADPNDPGSSTHTSDFAFGPDSSLTLYFETDAAAQVPEPAGTALALTALGAMALVSRGRRPVNKAA
jgi:hypothetical protein